MRASEVMGSDAALVKRVLAGQTECFRPLVEKYQDAVYAVGLSRSHRAADADEIAQETFIAAFESLAKLRDPTAFGRWIYRIAVNKAKTHLRAARLRREAQANLTEARRRTRRTSGSDKPDERRDQVHDAMRRLSAPNREAATLYYIDGYSVADISRFTARPAGTIKRRLHDARKSLRKELMMMVESELKKRRPGRKFTDAVLHKITRVQVWSSGKHDSYLLLSDSKGRAYRTYLGLTEAEAILPKVSGRGKGEGHDIHSALLRVLNELDYQIVRVTLSADVAPNDRVELKVRRGGRTKTVRVLYGERAAVQFAILTGAEVLYDARMAEKRMMRRKDGKPMSPAGAWRKIARGITPPFRNVRELFSELERDPDSWRARRALPEIGGGYRERPLLRDRGRGMDELKEWIGRKKGTSLEGVALGLMGAVHVDPVGDLVKARRYLERARRLRPTDRRIAFDLATVYALSGKADDAFALLEEFRFEEANRCENFLKLAGDRRFERIIGRVEPPHDCVFLLDQTHQRILFAGDRPWEHKARRRRTFGPVATTARASKVLKRRVGDLLDGNELAGVRRVCNFWGENRDIRWLLLELDDGRFAAVTLPSWRERRYGNLSSTLDPAPRPWVERSESTAAALRSLAIEVEAVVLRELRDGDFVAALLAKDVHGRAQVPIDALDGISLALAAKRPLLMSETLAERLCIRGKTARPLSAAGAMRKVRTSEHRPPRCR